ncbi:MAG: Plug domain-containing protein, partial [Bacteroidota bacterium]
EVVVEGKANKANDYHMERMKQNSATNIDYISQETARKAGDSRVSDAVRRVPGVTTVGSFVSVRGLADRYIKTTVNGSRIPTLDPFTNNFRLDLFPTGLIDNLVITKTLNPDLPGDWAGAYLSINTKDYPDQLMVEVSTSFGYTAQTTFRDIITSRKSRTDWLGFDNDLRDIPEGVGRDQTTFPFLVNPGL